MRTISSVPSGFKCANIDEIDRLEQTDELRPTVVSRPAAGTPFGTRTCAWSADCTYFAWPIGGGTVKLVPWDNKENKIVNSEDDRYTERNGKDPDQLINNNYKENTECRCSRYLEGVDKVWSVAFGSGSTKEGFSLTWKHLKIDKGLLLATGHQNGNIKVWDCNTGRLLLMLKDHRDIVKSLEFSPDGSLILLSGSRDGTLKFWDLNDDGNMYKSLHANNKWVYDAKWSPNCNLVASVGSDKSVILWKVKKFFTPLHIHGHYHDVVGCCFSPDSSLLATASFDTRVIIWDTSTGQSLQEMGHMFPPPRPIFAGGANEFYVRGISFHPQGQMIATINDDGYVRCWDLEEQNADPLCIIEHKNALSVTFSPKGHRISVGDKDGCVRFYQTPAKISRLQHLCRMTIRSLVKTQRVDFLHLPFRLKEYLKYHEYLKAK